MTHFFILLRDDIKTWRSPTHATGGGVKRINFHAEHDVLRCALLFECRQLLSGAQHGVWLARPSHLAALASYGFQQARSQQLLTMLQARKNLAYVRGRKDVDREFNNLVEAAKLAAECKHPWKTLFSKKYRPQLILSACSTTFQQWTGYVSCTSGVAVLDCAVPCHAVQCRAVMCCRDPPYATMQRCAMLCCAVLQPSMPECMLLCHCMLCVAVLCYAMLCCAVQCHDMPCYAERGVQCRINILIFYVSLPGSPH